MRNIVSFPYRFFGWLARIAFIGAEMLNAVFGPANDYGH
jgi:hypothetical protein